MHDVVDLFNYLSWILSCSVWIQFLVSHSFLSSVFEACTSLFVSSSWLWNNTMTLLDFRDNREYGDSNRDRSWGRKPVSLVDVQSFLKILCTHSIVTVVYYESIKRELKTQSGGSIGPFFLSVSELSRTFFLPFLFYRSPSFSLSIRSTHLHDGLFLYTILWKHDDFHKIDAYHENNVLSTHIHVYLHLISTVWGLTGVQDWGSISALSRHGTLTIARGVYRCIMYAIV